MTAGSANAASRGFKLRNESRQKLRLLGVNRVARFVCHGIPVKVCDDEFFDMEFEGRPGNGALLNPGGVHNWELKYSFDIGHLIGQTNYAARLTYKIEGTNGVVEVEIRTTNYANNSECNVIGDASFSCRAEGTNVTIR